MTKFQEKKNFRKYNVSRQVIYPHRNGFGESFKVMQRQTSSNEEVTLRKKKDFILIRKFTHNNILMPTT